MTSCNGPLRHLALYGARVVVFPATPGISAGGPKYTAFGTKISFQSSACFSIRKWVLPPKGEVRYPPNSFHSTGPCWLTVSLLMLQFGNVKVVPYVDELWPGVLWCLLGFCNAGISWKSLEWWKVNAKIPIYVVMISGECFWLWRTMVINTWFHVPSASSYVQDYAGGSDGDVQLGSGNCNYGHTKLVTRLIPILFSAMLSMPIPVSVEKIMHKKHAWVHMNTCCDWCFVKAVRNHINLDERHNWRRHFAVS
ncbi:hypothetical protein BDZ91DRAFT_759449 [Kalaharituber pfeilii]|nr:hypothetical protein BDZ91DRAFT_759449 [Kalaharituber pfeilii]